MAQSSEARRQVHQGFEGEIAGLGLPDVIQVVAFGHFSGCIEVWSEGGSGLIFLRDGEIVHAEQAEAVGEEAFRDILRWPGGRFSLQPNVSSTRSTIRKGCQHLLLDAHVAIDKDRGGRGRKPPARQAPRQAPARSPAPAMDRLRRIPGVAGVVLQRRDGATLGNDGYETEALAGQALYLSMVGARLGAALGAGDIHSAAVQGQSRHLLLFASQGHLLGVQAQGGAEIGPLEAEVRRQLGGGR